MTDPIPARVGTLHAKICGKQLNTGTGSTNCRLDEGHGGYCSAHPIAMRERIDIVDQANIVKPKDASDEAIRQAALETASRLGLFAKTWPEFYAFGLAVKVAALAALSQEETQGWRDISSAPKDGTFIVLRAPDWRAGAAIGKWFDFEGTIHGERGFWEGHAMEIKATGWMPLPSPPPVAAPGETQERTTTG